MLPPPERRAAFALQGLDDQIRRVVDTFDGRASDEDRAYGLLRFAMRSTLAVVVFVIMGEILR